MQVVVGFWHSLERRARIGLVTGFLVILGIVGCVAVWAYHPDYQVLFADLAPRDAAAMTAELDKMKVDYKLGGNGTSIMVPRELVYRTRLKLMGGDLPLQGAVGFEVFNNADFGMTEFVQRVNYLRAVQGELTRTIQSIDGIQAARVHLAIPEQGLFKKSTSKPKASVTIAMKQGQQLSPQQIAGIQRLVAASVPDVAMQDVTVLDQHGVALTRLVGDDTAAVGGAQLDAKSSTEDYLQKKIIAVLDRTFGAGQAIASVDVELALDRGTVTTEEVLPGRGGQDQVGVIVRQRSSVQDAPGASASADRTAAPAGNSSETEYQVGRRVEQRTIPSGEFRRMTIAIVVKQRLEPEQAERVRDLVAVAAGFNRARGDAIVVNSVDQLASPMAAADPAATETTGEPASDSARAPLPQVRPRLAPSDQVVAILVGLAALAVASGAVFLGKRRRSAEPHANARRLNDAERAKLLADVKLWIASGRNVEVARSEP